MEEKKKNKNLATVLWLIFFFPVGLYYLWSKTDWHKTIKWIITGFYIFILFLFILGKNTTPPPTTTANTVSAAPTAIPPTSVPQISNQMKNDYITYYKQYMNIANQSDATNTKIATDLNNAANGSSNATTADLYLEASDAHDTQENLKMQTVSLQIPDSLSNYHDDLQKADDDLFALIDSRSNAMKSMADYLNGGDLSKIKDVRDNTQSQDSEMLSAVANLVKVGTELGIDTSKIK